jgi:hypothetical protein
MALPNAQMNLKPGEIQPSFLRNTCWENNQ